MIFGVCWLKQQMHPSQVFVAPRGVLMCAAGQVQRGPTAAKQLAPVNPSVARVKKKKQCHQGEVFKMGS